MLKFVDAQQILKYTQSKKYCFKKLKSTLCFIVQTWIKNAIIQFFPCSDSERIFRIGFQTNDKKDRSSTVYVIIKLSITTSHFSTKTSTHTNCTFWLGHAAKTSKGWKVIDQKLQGMNKFPLFYIKRNWMLAIAKCSEQWILPQYLLIQSILNCTK